MTEEGSIMELVDSFLKIFDKKRNPIDEDKKAAKSSIYDIMKDHLTSSKSMHGREEKTKRMREKGIKERSQEEI